MKHILIIETDIPDPEFSVIAREKDTLDGFEAVEHREVIPPDDIEIGCDSAETYPLTDSEYVNNEQKILRQAFRNGAKWTLKRLGL